MHPTVAELVQRVRRGPEVVREAIEAPLPSGLMPWSETSLVLTGIGASGAVARTAEALLRHETSLRVSSLPLSEFVSRDVDLQGKTLVLLSQELSPNATLALQRVERFQSALLITSLAQHDERLDGFKKSGGRIFTLPPKEERDFLVRMMGPLTTVMGLLRLAWAGEGQSAPSELAQVPAAMTAALERGFEASNDWPDQVLRAPLLATGCYSGCLEVIRWTWMEAWWTEAPPVWDVLEVAHGPWQTQTKREGPWLAFTRPDDMPGLWPRFEAMLPPTQELVKAEATLPAPLCFFEHTAFVQGLLAGVLSRRDVDLKNWPGHGTDGPLYRFDGKR
ncbi:MAG: hypothetical protein ACO1OB_05540 [Archangium sp.]